MKIHPYERFNFMVTTILEAQRKLEDELCTSDRSSGYNLALPAMSSARPLYRDLLRSSSFPPQPRMRLSSDD
ncbi:hypothetical protein CRG98_024199 [Punica granatum]|uniref:Uncharacterized protein n=1 Tax=Punica granatum TaxID=22663 RepID=A0A2I0JII6_PUNGR|nr:hypothetical protein CRG98_024199 [Punica granatum]